MPILASVCWEAGFVWLCGVWVCGIPRVFACVPACACVLAGLACAWLRVCPCARVPACVCARVCSRACVWGGRACVRGPPLGGVLWRFPTLPHPLGCSTIGAAGLSFQVRNVAGRFPGAVTTTSLCRPPPLVGPLCGGVSWPAVWRGGGWVGRGSYSGCGSSVPPLLPCLGPCLWARRGWGVSGCSSPPCWPLFWCLGLGVPGPPPLWRCSPFGGVGAGLGGLVWCRPISTSRLASASRRFHLWPIDPLFWRGPLTPCWGVETSSRSGLPA